MEYHNLDVLSWQAIKYEEIAANYGYTPKEIDEMDALMFLQFLLAGKKRRYRDQMRLAQAISLLQNASEDNLRSFYNLFEEIPPEDYDFEFGRF